jgi:hypothetical protein
MALVFCALYERQTSKEFVLFDCQADFTRLAICIHTLIFFGNLSGVPVTPTRTITQKQRTINCLLCHQMYPNSVEQSGTLLVKLLKPFLKLKKKEV